MLLTTDEPYTGRYGVSSPEVFGTACIDARGSFADVVETIVHEASHQAFYLAEIGAPMVTATVYAPSPFRSGVRTVRRVVAGAQAFFNSVVTLETLPASRKSSQSAPARIVTLNVKLCEALSIASGHQTLSPQGNRWIEEIRNGGLQLAEVHQLSKSTILIPSGNHVPPWDSVISADQWFENLATRVESWAPDNRLHSDRSLLQSILCDAIRAHAKWLYHPCMAGLFAENPEERLQRDFQMIAWLSANTRLRTEIHVPKTLSLWTAEGPFTGSPGRYSSDRLFMESASLPLPVAVDAQAILAAERSEEYWTPARIRQERSTFQCDLAVVLNAMLLMSELMPGCLAWVAHATKVLVPLRQGRRTSMRSYSRPDIPGLVFMDVFADKVASIELLVRESAHLHFFLAESAGPVVTPDCTRLYWSPLRRDARPLRGIFLAYHALAFMNAAYVDMTSAGVLSAQESDRIGYDLRHKLLLSEAVLNSERRYLTDLGNHLLESPREVAHYAGKR